MSTKNLARTVIEGGRTNGSRWERRHSNGPVRAGTRDALVRAAADSAFDDLIVPCRKRVPRHFRDKLGPARRWLAAQTGRPWTDVLSDLLRLVDTRTTAGRHLLFDHML